MMDAFEWGLLIATGILTALAALMFVIIIFAAMSESFTLPKSEWECSNTRSQMMMMPVGKAVIPTTLTECDEYRRVQNSKP